MIAVKIWAIGIYPCFYSIIWIPYIFHMKYPDLNNFYRATLCVSAVFAVARLSVTLVGLWEDIISGTAERTVIGHLMD